MGLELGFRSISTNRRRMSESPLVGPRLKVDRAKQHIEDLDARICAFLDGHPYSVVMYDEPKTGDQVFCAVVREPVPVEWAVILGDALHNLRSALEHVAEQLILAGGGKTHSHSGFPISNTADEFRTGGIQRIEGASERAKRLVGALKPYKGGNEPLWWLHRLNIEDKHHLLVPVGAANRQIGMQLSMPVPWSDTPSVFPMGFTVQEPTFPLKDGSELFRVAAAARRAEVEAQIQYDYKFSFQIAFGKADILQGEPIFPTLSLLADTVECVIDTFERWVFK